VKAGLEREKAAVLVVLAALRDGRKGLVTLVPGHRESTEAWSEVLRDLRARGLQASEAGHRGRAPGDLGRVADRLPRRAGATVLELSDRQRPR